MAQQSTELSDHEKAHGSARAGAVDLLDIDEVCAFFGGTKPLHPATIYRGAGTRYPKPVKMGLNTNRWLRSECEAARQALIEASRAA